MKDKTIKIDLSKIANTALQEKVDKELEKVLDNILDPNPVTLRPYRTFNEVEQPASQFVFRINKLANLALFEADGGKWKLEAVESIANYLKNELASNKKITILA